MLWTTSGVRIPRSPASHIEPLNDNSLVYLLGLPSLEALSDHNMRPEMIPRVFRSVCQKLANCLLCDDQPILFSRALSHIGYPCLQRL
jgi:hypothetical protein